MLSSRLNVGETLWLCLVQNMGRTRKCCHEIRKYGGRETMDHIITNTPKCSIVMFLFPPICGGCWRSNCGIVISFLVLLIFNVNIELEYMFIKKEKLITWIIVNIFFNSTISMLFFFLSLPAPTFLFIIYIVNAFGSIHNYQPSNQ